MKSPRSFLPVPLFSRTLGVFFFVALLAFAPQSKANAQGASPALDLDRSGRIDGPDLFLFGSVWTNLYDLGLRNFNIADYFPLTGGNRWHYIAPPGRPVIDNFAFVVETETEMLPSGLPAIRVLNDFDDPSGLREGIVDFWRYDEGGNLFYEGFSNEFDIPFFGFTVPPQTVYFSDPVAFGRHDQEVTEVLESTSTARVRVVVEGNTLDVDFDIQGKIEPTSFLETFDTELGQFTDVLRMIFDVELTTTVDGFPIRIRFFNNTVFFKKHIGPIGIDLNPDQADFGALTIDEGTVVVDNVPTAIVAH